MMENVDQVMQFIEELKELNDEAWKENRKLQAKVTRLERDNKRLNTIIQKKKSNEWPAPISYTRMADLRINPIPTHPEITWAEWYVLDYAERRRSDNHRR